MKIIHNKNNDTCDIFFSWKEIFILILKRKIHLNREGFKIFGDSLLAILLDWKWQDSVKNNEESGIIKTK